MEGEERAAEEEVVDGWMSIFRSVASTQIMRKKKSSEIGAEKESDEASSPGWIFCRHHHADPVAGDHLLEASSRAASRRRSRVLLDGDIVPAGEVDLGEVGLHASASKSSRLATPRSGRSSTRPCRGSVADAEIDLVALGDRDRRGRPRRSAASSSLAACRSRRSGSCRRGRSGRGTRRRSSATPVSASLVDVGPAAVEADVVERVPHQALEALIEREVDVELGGVRPRRASRDDRPPSRGSCGTCLPRSAPRSTSRAWSSGR